jgi:hypothetical protein
VWNHRNELFWKMVWKHKPWLKGFDPITLRANAETPSQLFRKLNAHGPAAKSPGKKTVLGKVGRVFRPNKSDPSRLSDAAKRTLHINATLMDDTFIYMYALTDVLKDTLEAINVQYAPPKGLLRSEDKIMDSGKGGYKGDASLLRDQVRCTIVCKQELSAVQAEFHKTCNEESGLRLVKSKLDAHRRSVGYSDLNNVVMFPNDMYGEIQANSLNGLYGKEAKGSWMKATDQGPSEYLRLRSRVGIEGGFGHQLYEIARNTKNPKQVRGKADTLAKEYYDGIMKDGATKPRRTLEQEVKDFVAQHLGSHAKMATGGSRPPDHNPRSRFHVSMYELMQQLYIDSEAELSLLTNRPGAL